MKLPFNYFDFIMRSLPYLLLINFMVTVALIVAHSPYAGISGLILIFIMIVGVFLIMNAS